MNLLKITTTPLKLAISLERPRVKPIKVEEVVSKSVKNHRIKSKNNQRLAPKSASIKQDTYQSVSTIKIADGYIPMQLSSVNGYRMDLAQDNLIASKGGQEVSQLLQDRINDHLPQVAYIPISATGEIKWEPKQADLQFQSMQVDIDFDQYRKELEYIPGQLSFEIEQYPSVHIEFIGDPIYAPPSSNPNYKKD